MAKHIQKIIIDKDMQEVIDRALNWEDGDNMDWRFDEDDVLIYSADFGGGLLDNKIEMDIKCCGVQYENGGYNNAWCEAVLFEDGCEVACSEIDGDFFGEWSLTYGDEYVTIVEREE